MAVVDAVLITARSEGLHKSHSTVTHFSPDMFHEFLRMFFFRVYTDFTVQLSKFMK